ncbi:MAG: IS66 family insertion sequence element accessory protein TnpB [Candidatus Enterosoma sp.]|nr:IS66 family insertion sequence element accessory protein TnpB [Candidatus Enterosoma sp.]
MEKIEIEGKSIYLYSHQIDMKMRMEKIQVLLSQNFSPSELQDSIFVFISRSRKIAKVYVEDEFGRWLMIRKLNYTSFKIPRAEEDGKLTSLDVRYLMDGAEIVSERKQTEYA